MVQRFIISFLLCISLCTAWTWAKESPKFAEMSLSELEQYQIKIQKELRGLSKVNLSRRTGSIGYHSPYKTNADNPEWIEVDLGRAVEINEIILIPTIMRDPQRGYVADGFPEAFEIHSMQAEDDSFEVIAEYSMEKSGPPGIFPLIIPIEGVTASRIRVVATRLGKANLSSIDKAKAILLAELMVFSGEENVALRCPVKVRKSQGDRISWWKDFLVDGNLPYLMDSASGERSLVMASLISKDSQAAITIDLGQELPISRLRIHTEDKSDTVPQTYVDNNGLPTQFKLEGSRTADFLNSELLLEVDIKSSTNIGPIMEWAFEEKLCRYIRLTALDSLERLIPAKDKPHQGRIGFSEIEILSKGKNVALAKKVTATFDVVHKKVTLDNLTDGRNLYGNILPLREWLNELAQRHELQTQLPQLKAELTLRYNKQNRQLTWTIGLAGLLILGGGLLILNGRRLRKLQEAQIRERIAANLHDELGANLHAIGLLSDLAKEAVDDREDLLDTVERIRGLTKRTGQSAYRCSNMLGTEGFCDNLIEEMKEANRGLLGDIDHRFQYHGEELLSSLKRRTRIDLLMFYKECLANIIRHSEATMVEVELSVDQGEIRMNVTDNGKGLDAQLPKALARRARLLGANFRTKSPDSGKGTEIILILKTHKWNLLPR